ncbi:MAG: preprotein translocase subunit SecD [Acidimicrobiales bacterium]|jgi:preprotein translocase subunit SecD
MSNNKPQKKEGGSESFIRKFHAVSVLAVITVVGFFVYTNSATENAKYPFKLGLDLAGGAHLVYEADVSKIAPAEVADLMNVLREVIEKRVDPNGVSESIVQVESSGFISGSAVERLVVELPGVKDVTQAVEDIGKAPLLEFRLIDQEALAQQATVEVDGVPVEETVPEEDFDPFIDTGLTGRYLASAALEFSGGSGGQLSNEPIVSIVFDAEGGDLFETITREHTGENLAIFLDGQMISSPRINEAIVGGRAVISGGFTPDEAKDLAQNLSFGALPVPITLVSTQTVGASLGEEVLNKGVKAGAVGFGLVIIFMMFWYRLPGVVAGVSLIGYVAMMLALFKLIPVTLTAAGLAGFVLSLGMAVDANVLVFERMKEEYRSGKNSHEAARVGFRRAWSAIRDGNITSLLSAIILFWAGTALVKGFAVVFGLGIVISMISALLITRTLLLALPEAHIGKKTVLSKLYNSGIKTK